MVMGVVVGVQILPTLAGRQWLAVFILVVQVSRWAGSVHVIEELEQ